MKAFASYVLLSIQSILLVSASATIQLGISGAPQVSNTEIEQRQDDSHFVEVPLWSDRSDIAYYANVSIGTPPQVVVMQIDTGSSEIWAISADAEVTSTDELFPGTSSGRFNSSLSNTFEVNNDLVGKFSIVYGDKTSSSGDFFKDTITFGADIAVKSSQMGLVKKTGIARGIMGLGPRLGQASNSVELGDKRFTYPSLLETMVTQEIISTEAYSLWLNDIDSAEGSLLFGAIDTEKFEGTLANLAMYPLPGSDNDISKLITSFTSLSLTTETGNSALTPEGFAARYVLLDSGATNSFVPDDIAQAIYQITGAEFTIEYNGFPVNLPIVPCTVRDVKATFEFGFGGSGGPIIKVPIVSMIYAATFNGKPINIPGTTTPACILGILPQSIMGLGSNFLIFGDTFLRSAYVVYDLTNLRIGIAQSKPNVTESNIIQFPSSGAPIPSATTIENEVTPEAPTISNSGTPTRFTQAPGATFTGSAGSAFASAYQNLGTAPTPDVSSIVTPTGAPSTTANSSKGSSSSGASAATGTKKPGAGFVVRPVFWEQMILIGMTITLALGGGLLL